MTSPESNQGNADMQDHRAATWMLFCQAQREAFDTQVQQSLKRTSAELKDAPPPLSNSSGSQRIRELLAMVMRQARKIT